MYCNRHRPPHGGSQRLRWGILPLLAPCLLLSPVGQADPPLYRVTSLGELSGEPGGWSEAYGLNDLGQVVGITQILYEYGEDDCYPVRAFFWLPVAVETWELDQGMHDLGILGGDPCTVDSEARDINEHGQIVGTSGSQTGDLAFLWFPELFDDFPVQELYALPEFEPAGGAWGWALENGGHGDDPLYVVGWGIDGECSGDYPPDAKETGFLWHSDAPGFLARISPPDDVFEWEDSRVYAINPTFAQPDQLVLGGEAHYCGPQPPSAHYGAIGLDCQQQVYVPRTLLLPEDFGGPYSKARDATDEGELVGWGKDEQFENRDRALYWETVIDCPVNLHEETGIDGGDETRAEAIARPDGLPYVVGWNAATNHALLWKCDSQGQWSVEDLNNLIGTQAQVDWELVEAHDINNGTSIPGWGGFPTPWIVGWGVYGVYPNEKHRAFLLSTEKDCPQDLDFDGDIDTSDLLILLGNWDYCPEGEVCWSDINMDGAVNTADLLSLLGHWGACGKPGGGIPQTVQDCIDKFGFGDPEALEACIQAVTGGLE